MMSHEGLIAGLLGAVLDGNADEFNTLVRQHHIDMLSAGKEELSTAESADAYWS